MYPESEYIDLSSKDVLKLAFYVLAVLAVLLTVAVGFALSRWMARQIVEPVERMRDMADAISQGDLDHPVPILSRDEIGDTCQSFEQMRLQLRAARDTREKFDQNRKELLAGISHDLSTPLTKIEGYASGLVDGIANTPEKQRHYVAMIRDTSRHMAELVQTLFLFSKLDLGQIPFHWEAVDIKATLPITSGNRRRSTNLRDWQSVLCRLSIRLSCAWTGSNSNGSLKISSATA